MIRTKTILAGLLMICGMAQFTPVMGQQTVETHEVRNYFYLHDTIPQTCLKITSQEQFDRYFGPAAFMGKDGEPTQIDFGREFVVAKVFPQTYHAVELNHVRLMAGADSVVTLRYHYAEGVARSYTIRPLILLAVPNAYSRMRLTEESDSLCYRPQGVRERARGDEPDEAQNGVLIIWYDSKTGKKPLLRAVRRKRCKHIYDYKMLSGIAVSLPPHADKQQLMQYFRGVKGVLGVQEDKKVYLYSHQHGVEPMLQ